jgi:hypothetical protein
VVILGSADGVAVLYEFTGTRFRVIPFPPLFSEPDVANHTRLSRDGQCVVTRDDLFHPEFSVSLPALWNRSWSNTFLYPNLPLLTDDWRLNPSDVANTPNGPLVVASDYPTSIFWTLQDGLTPWIINNNYFTSRLTISRLSADGQVFAGYELFIEHEGGPVILRAISGTRTNFSYLPPRNSHNSEAMAISPNGRFISGFADLHPVLWHDGKVKRLLPGKYTPAVSDTVTDHGFAGLRTSEGPMIYDPRLRKAAPFSEWWASHYPQAPLPYRIRRITDLYEHGGNLYCLLNVRDEVLEANLAVLVIAPIPELPANPKSWWAEPAFDEAEQRDQPIDSKASAKRLRRKL